MAAWYSDVLGSDAAAGTIPDPWYWPPGCAGSSNGSAEVGAAPVLNIKSGAYYSGINAVWDSIITQATYQGYGGTGKWTLDCRQIDDVAFQNGNTRINTVIKNLRLLGYAGLVTQRVAMSVGTAGLNSGFRLEDSEVWFGSSTGFAADTLNIRFKNVQIRSAGTDLIKLVSSVSNGYRAGSSDVFERLWALDPNQNIEVGGGDCFQALIAGATQWEGSCTFLDSWFRNDTSNFFGKQAALFWDGLGGITIKGLRCEGVRGVIGFGSIRGTMTFSGVSFRSNREPVGLRCFRMFQNTGGLPTYMMVTGSVANIYGTRLAGWNAPMFRMYDPAAIQSYDGVINFLNSTVQGRIFNDPVFTQPAHFELYYSAGEVATYGANFRCNLRNNLCLGVGDDTLAGIRMPNDANNLRWVFQNNVFLPNTKHYIGSTVYANTAAFQAAHSYATGNVELTEEQCRLDSAGRPTLLSPLLYAGVQGPIHCDASGVQRHIPPSIGALEYIPPRTAVR
jgi:hypothetical protein